MQSQMLGLPLKSQMPSIGGGACRGAGESARCANERLAFPLTRLPQSVRVQDGRRDALREQLRQQRAEAEALACEVRTAAPSACPTTGPALQSA